MLNLDRERQRGSGSDLSDELRLVDRHGGRGRVEAVAMTTGAQGEGDGQQ